MASLDDILSSARQIPIALNGVANATLTLAGKQSSGELSTTSVVKSSGGWVAKVSVVVAGSTDGMIYDCATTATAIAGARLADVPKAIGITTIGLPTNNGITFVPGTGMIAVISFT